MLSPSSAHAPQCPRRNAVLATAAVLALTGALGAAAPGVAAPIGAAGVRITGLERLYFERVADLASRFTTDQSTGERAALPLPERLAPPAAPDAPPPKPEEPPPASEDTMDPESQATEPETPPEVPESEEEAPPEPARTGPDLMVTVDDFTLPTVEGEPALTLRQVVAWPESRVKEVYWALYEGGRRQDVWWFTPVHRRAEGKILPNHRLTGVSRRDGRIVLQGIAEWDPAGGSYSERGERLFFRLERGELRFELLLAPYGFSQWEEVTEKEDGDFDYRLRYAAFVERLVAGPEGERIERRALDQASDELVARCVARDEAGEPCLECGDPSHAARCLAESPGAVLTSRSTAEPSFVEVGGRASGWK